MDPTLRIFDTGVSFIPALCASLFSGFFHSSSISPFLSCLIFFYKKNKIILRVWDDFDSGYKGKRKRKLKERLCLL